MQEIASIAFSSDSKILAAQGGAPEWNLVIWSWEKSKVLASVKTGNALGSPVNQVCKSDPLDIPDCLRPSIYRRLDASAQILFAPGSALDGNIIVSAVGNGIFKTYRYQENALRPMPTSMAKREPQNYTCHAWLVEGEAHATVLLFCHCAAIKSVKSSKAALPMHTVHGRD